MRCEHNLKIKTDTGKFFGEKYTVLSSDPKQTKGTEIVSPLRSPCFSGNNKYILRCEDQMRGTGGLTLL